MKRLAPLFPLAMLLIVCGIASRILTGCGATQPTAAVPSRPLRLEGVPTIRVRLHYKPQHETSVQTTAGYRVLIDGHQRARSLRRLPPTTLKRDNGVWTMGMLSAAGEKLVIIPEPDSFVGVDKRLYRGSLVILANGPDGFYVQNHLDMESYLASVIAKELYPDFHLQCYRAQAVAARTFALYEKLTRGQNNPFDVWDSQRSQVYKGMLAETDKSWAAVQSTHAYVLAYGPPGEEKPFLTQFSACNGGTVNGANVLREVDNLIPPLQGGQRDPDGDDCPQWRWGPLSFKKADLFPLLSQTYSDIRRLGPLKTIRVKEATSYGRPIWLEVVARNGKSVELRAESLRLTILRSDLPGSNRLYSMNCKIRDTGEAIEFYDGRGFGHGVGLSQWGAEEKARDGQSAEAILEFYYPGSSIFRAY